MKEIRLTNNEKIMVMTLIYNELQYMQEQEDLTKGQKKDYKEYKKILDKIKNMK